MAKIAIIGGGISGLAAAYKLLEIQKEKKSHYEITLFEADARLGGTIETEIKDGFILEKGPDSFISEKPWAMDLCRRLGIENEVIGTNTAFRKGFILKKNALMPIPEGFYLIAPTKLMSFFGSPLFSLKGKLRMMMEPFIPRVSTDTDESIASFIRRRFGNEALTQAGQAMIAGIYTGDPENLSLLSTMPKFKTLEKEHGSVVRGLLSQKKKKKTQFQNASGPRYSLFLSFREGMETFTKVIGERIPKDWLRLHQAVISIKRNQNDKHFSITLADKSVENFDAVCLTVSAKSASFLLKGVSQEVSEELMAIPYESVATINLGYRATDIHHKMDGFGFVVPAKEASPLIACTFCSQKFEKRAPKGHVLLRAFVGGAFGRDFFQKEDQELKKDVERELSEILKITARPIFSSLKRYPDSMVQYEVGHLKRLSKLEEELEAYPGLYLTGSAYKGVGIPDCIQDAEAQAVRMADYLEGKRSR